MTNGEVKILILCYDFPPLSTIGGLRPKSWFDYFPDNGVHPIIITRKWSENIIHQKDMFKPDRGSNITTLSDKRTLIRVPIKKRLRPFLNNTSNPALVFFRKTITLFETLTKWFLPKVDSKYPIYLMAKKYLEEHDVDCIIVTGEPFILFKYAYALNKRFGIPYILDYRDGWTTDHAKKNILLKLTSHLEKGKEKKFLNSSLFYSAASKDIIVSNNEIFGIDKSYCHENGIDVKTIREVRNTIKKTKKHPFRITYTGSLYDEHDIKNFLESIIEIDKEMSKGDIEVIFVGIEIKNNRATQQVISASRSHSALFKIIKPVSHATALEYQINSHVLLKFDFTGQSSGLLGAKLYEYASTGNQIITVLSTNDKGTTFYANRNVQKLVFGKEEIKQAILELYESHLDGVNIKNDLTEKEIQSFSRETHIKTFSEEIKHHLNNFQ